MNKLNIWVRVKVIIMFFGISSDMINKSECLSCIDFCMARKIIILFLPNPKNSFMPVYFSLILCKYYTRTAWKPYPLFNKKKPEKRANDNGYINGNGGRRLEIL